MKSKLRDKYIVRKSIDHLGFAFFILISIFLLSSCKHFFDGETLLTSLQEAIEYSNAPYAKVEIKASSSAIEYMYPAAGEYNQNYKAGDSFEIKFTPKEHYQFVKWIATPKESVSFKQNSDDSEIIKTMVTIENDSEPIKIEPLVFKKPTVTVSPGNIAENPKNSTIVISFSESMNINEENVRDISITIDGIDARENFEAPKINLEKTEVTFLPKRDNMIQVGSVVRVVQVTVPKTFSYTKENQEICLEKLFSYSFVINSTTEDKAEIAVTCPIEEGEISFSGNRTLYLDDSITLSVSPKDSYSLQKWNVKYEDNQPVEKSVLQVDEVDKSTIKLTLLTGASKKINIQPVFHERGFVLLNFYTKNGYITPSVPKSYLENEEFTVQYKSDGKHLFSNWKAVDKNGKKVDYVTFADEKAAETTCQVLAGGEEVTIIAESFEQPEITGFAPDFSTLVPYNSAIKVLFSLSMSNSCIYWTKDELQALGVTEENYDIFETEIRKFSEDNPYYYAYQKKGKPETLTYKNIEILNHNAEINLLSCYAEPFFETTENKTLVIYAKDNPGNTGVTSVDVQLSSEFVSKDNVPINQSLVKTYQCSSEETKPNVSRIELSSIKVSGDSTDYGKITIKTDDFGGNIRDWESTDENNKNKNPNCSTSDSPEYIYGSAPVISKDKVITFKVKGKYTVTDSSTAPAKLICKAKQITDEDGKTNIQMIDSFDNYNYIYSELCPSYDFSEDGIEIKIDMRENPAGCYQFDFITETKNVFFTYPFYFNYLPEKK